MRRSSLLSAFAAMVLGVSASFGSTAFVDFENNPSLPQGPSVFGSPAQTIVVPGVATFSGGTVLGLATNFPAIIFATSPNTYSTAEYGGQTLRTITVDIDPTFSVTEVSFALFNGNVSPVSYQVNAFDGAALVGSQSFPNVPSNLDQGFVLPDVTALNITRVEISTVATEGFFDFLTDSFTFNQKIQDHFVPVPPAAFSGLSVLGGLGLLRLRRVRKA